MEKGQARHLFSHAEAEPVLRRMGYSQEQIEDMLRDLPDPIDGEREAETLFKLGISIDALRDRMGGSL
ncbi:MAG TPA: hypothetical protein VGX51_09260 [Solirubrobacteraceae bacterium]|jgi:hypothetical protein|nr:hypothetical protein [Solirubrobacteraceae bacterium]